MYFEQSMDGRRAYEALILGNLARDYRATYAGFRRSLLRRADSDLLSEGVLTSEDIEVLAAARTYCKSSEQNLKSDPRAFDSIYDLLLFYEMLDLFDADKEGRMRKQLRLYRGHRDTSWSLAPSLYRGDPRQSYAQLRNGAKTVVRYGSEVRLTLAPLQILAVLQHYGWKTPLLDFTTNIRIAAAFACRGYEEGQTAKYGTVIALNNPDYEGFTDGPGTLLGQTLMIKADDIPRIRCQQGVFVSGFKADALEHFLKISTYSFKHGIASITFPEVAGLTEPALFPIGDALESYLHGNTSHAYQPLSSEQAALVDETMRLVHRDAQFTSHPIHWTDYLSAAKKWMDWDALPPGRKHEVLVLTRWFWLLQRLDLPLLCKSWHVLRKAVSNIVIDPFCTAESASDIQGRLVASARKDAAPLIRSVFATARQDVEKTDSMS